MKLPIGRLLLLILAIIFISVGSIFERKRQIKRVTNKIRAWLIENQNILKEIYSIFNNEKQNENLKNIYAILEKKQNNDEIFDIFLFIRKNSNKSVFTKIAIDELKRRIENPEYEFFSTSIIHEDEFKINNLKSIKKNNYLLFYYPFNCFPDEDAKINCILMFKHKIAPLSLE